MENYNDTTEPTRQERYYGASKTNSIMRAIFGIFMVIIYVGMGVLLLINFFNWGGDWGWTRWIVGVVLIIYGFWRAYRQWRGIDTRL